MTAISNFCYITLDELIKKNKHWGEEEVEDIEYGVRLRNANIPCDVCGNEPIWAVGSGLCGWPGCFTCITGESDASEDYEVI